MKIEKVKQKEGDERGNIYFLNETAEKLNQVIDYLNQQKGDFDEDFPKFGDSITRVLDKFGVPIYTCPHCKQDITIELGFVHNCSSGKSFCITDIDKKLTTSSGPINLQPQRPVGEEDDWNLNGITGVATWEQIEELKRKILVDIENMPKGPFGTTAHYYGVQRGYKNAIEKFKDILNKRFGF